MRTHRSVKDVAKVRKQLRLSREELARRLGVSVTTVFRWEHGVTKTLSPLAFEKLGKLLSDSAGSVQ